LEEEMAKLPGRQELDTITAIKQKLIFHYEEKLARLPL
jgi:hypothetical protein